MTEARGIEKAKINESLLSQIWKHQRIKREALQISSGERVRVIHPGWLNEDSGPDFRQALIALNGDKLLQGDIELHLTTRGWQEHGHDRDPEYDGVILHVVMWGDGEKPTLLHTGRTVPTLVLHPYLEGSLEQLQQTVQSSLPLNEPCHAAGKHLGAAVLGDLLDKAGEERFHSKEEQFKRQLAVKDANQVLYEGIMKALGYAKNKIPAEELARRLPLVVLRRFSLSRPLPDSVLTLQALLLGTAGLLPKQRPRKGRGEEVWVRELERQWDSLGISQTMSRVEWRFFRVRPENFPTGRLAAVSYLLVRHGEEGLLQSVLRTLRQVDPRKDYKRLEQEFTVTATGYWATHFDFGVEAWGNRSLIGRGRAREIVVNILLPFGSVWAEMTSQPRLKEQALEIYRAYPRSGENRVTRYMERQIAGADYPWLIDSSRRQQGLIHLYQTLCTRRLCHQCTLVSP